MRLSLLLSAAVLSAALLAPAAQAAPAGKFLREAIQGDNSEMMLGRLAEQRGGPGVRDFGAALVRDHAAAKRQAAGLARRMGMRIPTGVMPEARAEYRKLLRMRGRDFDREFARYMVRDHRKDISDFEDQSRTGEARTAALARQTLPALRKHLRMAQGLGG